MRLPTSSTVGLALALALVAGSAAGAQAPDTTKKTPRRSQVRIPVRKEPAAPVDTATPAPAPAPAPAPTPAPVEPAPAPAPVAPAARDTFGLVSRWEIGLLPTVEVSSVAGRAAPGIAIGSPVGFGANWGDGFVGVGYQDRIRYENTKDGGAVVGLGFGNARDNLGLEVAVTSASTWRRGFFKAGTVSGKVHRVFPRNWAAAIGYENAARWGGLDGGDSWYGVLSKVVHLSNEDGDPFSNITLNGGVGNGRFQRFTDFRAGKEGFYPFASASVRVLRPLSAIIDWSAGDLAAGLSIAPFKWVPLVITPAVVDITNQANDPKGGPRFTLGVGMGFRWNGIRNIFLSPR